MRDGRGATERGGAMPRSEDGIKKKVREKHGHKCFQCGMTAEEHKQRFGKHDSRPTILRRDKFRCTECGTKAEDQRNWASVLRVHRLSGDCEEECGPEADPSGFATLCIECHEKRHPDRFAEYIGLGGEV